MSIYWLSQFFPLWMSIVQNVRYETMIYQINFLSLIFRKKGKAETERNEYANNAWSGKRAKQKVKRINLCSSATFCSGIFFKLKIVDKSLFCPSL